VYAAAVDSPPPPLWLTPARPPAMGEAQQRLLYNLSYYRSNYVLVFLGLTAYILCAARAPPSSATMTPVPH
jgi:hypothetical protein